MNRELSPERVKRIAHIKSHLEGGFKLDQLVRNVENGLGNPSACVMSLSRHAEACGFYAWFEERDLTSLRQWFHTAAKLDRKWYQMEEDKQAIAEFGTSDSGASLGDILGAAIRRRNQQAQQET